MLLQASCIISQLSFNSKMGLQSWNAQFGSKSEIFFIPCDLEIWQITLKNNRTPLLCHYKLCASFHKHRWIKTWVTIRKHQSRVKIGNFWSRVTLKFDRWPWKTIGHLFYATSSFVHHFTSFFTVNYNSSYSPKTPNLGQNLQFLIPCHFEIWQMTLKNNRALFLCYSKLCMSFPGERPIQIGVTVRKRPIRVQIGNFSSHVTLKFDGWPWK